MYNQTMADKIGREEIYFYVIYDESGYPVKLSLNLSDVKDIDFKELRLCFNEQFGE